MIRHAEIKLILPHRHPMLLVDAVLDVREGQSVKAIKNVSRNEPCFATLPPDRPQTAFEYPPSLIVESFCQSAGILQVLSTRDAAPAGSLMLFGAVSNLEFHGAAYAGETLVHEARIETALSDAAIFSGTVSVADRVIMTVERVVVALRPTDALAAAQPTVATGTPSTVEVKATP
jgi:3-hydroxyacyl-[acyl-carrier-protein] dehydratase